MTHQKHIVIFLVAGQHDLEQRRRVFTEKNDPGEFNFDVITMQNMVSALGEVTFRRAKSDAQITVVVEDPDHHLYGDSGLTESVKSALRDLAERLDLEIFQEVRGSSPSTPANAIAGSADPSYVTCPLEGFMGLTMRVKS